MYICKYEQARRTQQARTRQQQRKLTYSQGQSNKQRLQWRVLDAVSATTISMNSRWLGPGNLIEVAGLVPGGIITPQSSVTPSSSALLAGVTVL